MPDNDGSQDKPSPTPPATGTAVVEKKPEKVEKAKPAKAAPKIDLSVPPPAPPWWQTLRTDPPPHTRIALAVGFTGVVLLLWWFLTRGGNELIWEMGLEKPSLKMRLEVKFIASLDRIVPASKFPSLGDVLAAFPRVMDSDSPTFFFKHLFATLERVFIGVGLAAIVGVGLGIAAAAQRGINAAISPLVVFLRSVPMGPLVPLTIALFGIGEQQKTRFLFLALVGFVFADTVKAMSIVPERYVETAQTLGASRFQIVRKVLVPLAIPDIITSLRFQLGLGLGYITLAEAIKDPESKGGELGIGFVLNSGERLSDTGTIWAMLLLIAATALLLDLLLRTLQRGAFRWRKDL